MEFFEKTQSSETIFEGKIFTVKKEKVLCTDNHETTRDMVYHNGGAGIIAIDENRNVQLVRQYRKGADSTMLEIPAGKLEKGEDPLECSIRELEEETGYTADKIVPLGSFFPTPAYCTEKIYLYMATGLKKGKQHLDEGELLEVTSMNIDDLYTLAMDGTLTDAKTIIAVLKAYNLLKQR